MKKLIALLLTACMTISLAACGGSNAGSSQSALSQADLAGGDRILMPGVPGVGPVLHAGTAAGADPLFSDKAEVLSVCLSLGESGGSPLTHFLDGANYLKPPHTSYYPSNHLSRGRLYV